MHKKITVVVNGRFHAFDYAVELQKKGMLDKLISTMPYSIAKKFGIERKKYVGLPIYEAIKHIWRFIFKRELPTLFYSKIFTRTALLFISRNTDVIISFAGYSKEIFESKDHKKAIKILDRGSTHTIANIQLRRLAANYHGVNYISHSKNFIDRELVEYDLSDKILVPSNFVEKTFLENGISKSKIILIPYAFSSKKFLGISDKLREIKEPYILFVGQISVRKGIGVLIDAMKIVIKDFPDFKLRLVGSIHSNFNQELLSFPWVDYKGVLKGEDLYDSYYGATAFCLPSFEEGLALVLTEAHYFGLPIIATPNTGVETLVNNQVDKLYLFPAGDPIFLSQKIIECLIDELAIVRKRVLKISSERSWETFTNHLISNLDEKI